MTHATCGGVTLFALAPEDDGSVLTIAWGQNASNGTRTLLPIFSFAPSHSSTLIHRAQASSDLVRTSRRARRSQCSANRSQD